MVEQVDTTDFKGNVNQWLMRQYYIDAGKYQQYQTYKLKYQLVTVVYLKDNLSKLPFSY